MHNSPFRSLNIFLQNHARHIIQYSTMLVKCQDILTKLRPAETTPRRLKQYTARVTKLLREGRECVRIRISVYLALYLRTSRINLVHTDASVGRELFYRIKGFTIIFHLDNNSNIPHIVNHHSLKDSSEKNE